ncbi:MAG TPA: hypothetical protein VGV37_10290 [Aliidongia sp.]|uniref:hypothetical protein n=1 Tax=Aliidongia sp. TaxID=1914230 RepID=UPI002DDCEBF8|nr:hypothetical protein [Aliidongia sp.]HEV2674919.1 hypothetical protein [Aliidongia sp.]
MKFFKHSFLLFLLFASAGCVTPSMDVSGAINTYREVQPCCTTFQQVSFEKLPRNEGRSFTLAATDPAFLFRDGGLSYFRAFEIPESAKDSEVILRSYIFGIKNNPGNMAVIYPDMEFLDRDKRPIEGIKVDYTYLLSSLTDEPNSSHRFQLTAIVPHQDNLRYVIVHAASDQLGVTKLLPGNQSELTVPIGRGFVPVGGNARGTMYRATGSPVGPADSLRIKVRQAGD